MVSNAQQTLSCDQPTYKSGNSESSSSSTCPHQQQITFSTTKFVHIRACETETHPQETAEASEANSTIFFDNEETPRLSVLRSMSVFLSMTVLLCYREHAHGIKELKWLRPSAKYHDL